MGGKIERMDILESGQKGLLMAQRGTHAAHRKELSIVCPMCYSRAKCCDNLWGIIYGQNCNEDARIYCVWLNEDAANGCVFY